VNNLLKAAKANITEHMGYWYSALRLRAQTADCLETMHVSGVYRHPKSTKCYTA